jgi:hypothetical protein
MLRNSKGKLIEELDVEPVYFIEKLPVLGKRKWDSSVAEVKPLAKKPIVNEMEILAWCEFYLASKKNGLKMF